MNGQFSYFISFGGIYGRFTLYKHIEYICIWFCATYVQRSVFLNVFTVDICFIVEKKFNDIFFLIESGKMKWRIQFAVFIFQE